MARSPLAGERTWLVHPSPELPADQGTEVIQGDFAWAGERMEVRLRRIGEPCFQTVKSAGGLVRGALEVALTKPQCEALWPATAGRRLARTRYRVPWAGRHSALEGYDGSLAGLVVAAVECPSAGERAQLTVPPWCGTAVTEDEGDRNVHLARHGKPGRPSPQPGTNLTGLAAEHRSLQRQTRNGCNPRQIFGVWAILGEGGW
jgi:CYTH domain-containing protein